MPNAKGYSSKINGVRFISDFINVVANISSDGECQGKIIIGSDGVQPVEYSIDNGKTFQSSNIFTGLCQGDYLIVVRDKNRNRGRSVGHLFDQLPCGDYAGDTLQQVIDTNIVLANVLNCTLNDFL